MPGFYHHVFATKKTPIPLRLGHHFQPKKWPSCRNMPPSVRVFLVMQSSDLLDVRDDVILSHKQRSL